MRRPIMLALVAIALVLIGFPMTAMILSELDEVVVIKNRAPSGETETTRIWIVDGPDGAAWIRAADDKRWAELTRQVDRVEIRRNGSWQSYLVQEIPGELARTRVNTAMRAKYGLADWMIEQMRDTSRAIPFRVTRATRPAQTTSRQ